MRTIYEPSQYTMFSHYGKPNANEGLFSDYTQTQKSNHKHNFISALASGVNTTANKTIQQQYPTSLLRHHQDIIDSPKLKKNQIHMPNLLSKYKFNEKELQFFKSRFDNISNKGILTEKLFRKSMGILGIDHLSYISDRIFLLIDRDQDGEANFDDYIAYLDTIINGSDLEKAYLSYYFLTMHSSDHNKLFYTDIEQMVNQVSLVWKDLSGSTVYPQQQYIENLFRKLDVNKKGYVEFEDYYNTYCLSQDIFSWYELFNGDEMMEKQIKVINEEQKVYEKQVNSQIKKNEMCNLKTISYLFGVNNEVTNCLISLKEYEKISLQVSPLAEQPSNSHRNSNESTSHQINKQIMSLDNYEKALFPHFSNQLLFNNNHNNSTLFLTSILHDQNSYINNSFLSSSYQGPLSILQPTQNHLGDLDPEEEEDEYDLAQEKFELQEIQQQMVKNQQIISESEQLNFLDKLEEKIRSLLSQTEDLEIYLDQLVNKDDLTSKNATKRSDSQKKSKGTLINLVSANVSRDDNKESNDSRMGQRILSIQSISKAPAKFSQTKIGGQSDSFQKYDQHYHKSLSQRKATISNIPSHKKNKSTRRNISIYVGHENWNLVFVMMIGIRGSIKGLANINMYKQIDAKDFTQKNKKDLIRTQQFNDQDFIQYRFTDYAPLIFERIRQTFNINKESYTKSLGPESLLGNLIMGNMTNLSELCASTKSFHRFQYYSEDGKFVIRAITKGQAQFVKKILKSYFNYMNQNFQTLIMRLYGMYKIRFNKKGKKILDSVYFIVTHNVFSTELEIDMRYELKGSTHNRTARKGSSNLDKTMSLKDLDLQQDQTKIKIGLIEKNLLLKQLQLDSQFLAQMNIINYYILLGIHNITEQETMRINMMKESNLSSSITSTLYKDREFTNKNQSSISNSIQEKQRFYEKYKSGMLSEDEKEIYYIGIINIFTEYKSTQKLVHSFKSTFFGSSITTVPPNEYAKRLTKFVQQHLLD